MVGLFIKTGTLLFGNTEIGVRIVFLLAQLGSLFIIKSLIGDKNKNLLLVLYSTMPLLMFSGVFALPDTPLLFFSCCFFYFIKNYLDRVNYISVLGLALSIVCMFYSKYHGLLIVLLTVVANLNFLRRKSFWIVAFLVVALFLPHMYWQYTNDFVSFKFHLTGRTEKHFDLQNIIYFVFGQFFLFGSLNVFVFGRHIKIPNKEDCFNRILFFNSFGFLTFLLIMSFRNQIEANWTVTACAAFIVLICRTFENTKRLYLSSSLSIILVVGGYLILFFPKIVINNFDIEDNRLNEIVDWKTERIVMIEKLCGERRIVGDNYQISSKLSFYTGQKIAALHKKSRESHFSLLNLEKNIPDSEAVCYLTSALRYKSIRIETFFKDPVYVVPKISMGELRQ